MTVSRSDAAAQSVRCHVCVLEDVPALAQDQPVVGGGSPVGVDARGPVTPSCFDAARSKVMRNEACHDFSHVRVRAEVG
jgi:hypothetical protein